MGTSEILQSDKAPKGNKTKQNKQKPSKVQNMKGIIYILYLVLAPILCFKNYTPLEDWEKRYLQQLLKTILTNIYM